VYVPPHPGSHANRVGLYDVAHRVVGASRPKSWPEKEVAEAVPSRLGGLASTKITSSQCGSNRAEPISRSQADLEYTNRAEPSLKR
jgi:hypothetical protein